MTRAHLWKTSALVIPLAALLWAPLALAGGPLANCSSGRPYLWGSGGAGIPFNPDQGNLGPLAHAQAVAAVADAFAEWANVASSTASYTQGAVLPVDVTVSNFLPYYDAPAPDGLSAIVFDHTGEIFNLLFGAGSGILGFAGPEWGNVPTCTITEGLSFLNGPAFTDLEEARDVMVHEFGHYTNLAHTAVNGQIFLSSDHSGPTPNNTFGSPSGIGVIETMYPFYFGGGSGTGSLERDDVSMVSTLYPAADFASTTASLAGTILASNGTTRLSGVNVIARNVADPFEDAVSAVSGDFTDSTSQTDPVTGTYRLNGLTPGASYAVYVDRILAGGFSTSPIQLPGPEEFHSGAAESNGDDPATYAAVSAAAGGVASGVNVIFNMPRAGDPLPVGDDSFVQLALPFPFRMCGVEYNAVFVNANGNLTFGASSTDLSESTREFVGTLPRIAAVWDDLNPARGGTVTYEAGANHFAVTWDKVPEFGTTNQNTFRIELTRESNHVLIRYGDIAATDGLAGLSCGPYVNSGFELEEDLRTLPIRRNINMNGETAVFEAFTAADNDLDGYELEFVNLARGFDDVFEPNDTVATARPIWTPFNTASRRLYSELEPDGSDVDFYRVSLQAGDYIAIELVRGGMDAVLGVFDAASGALLIADDDSGAGLLSRLLLQANVDLEIAIGVSAYPDLEFDGGGQGSGRYVLHVQKYRGTRIVAGDDTATSAALGMAFPYQGGSYTSAFVNSNGNLTFAAGDTDLSESVPEFLARGPRIAALWDDLDPRRGLIIVNSGSATAAVHYVSVPEFGADTANYFDVHLTSAGAYAIQYGATNRNDALIGVTQGGGAANPGPTDLSSVVPLFPAAGTVYEQFGSVDGVDLSYRQLLFLPL